MSQQRGAQGLAPLILALAFYRVPCSVLISFLFTAPSWILDRQFTLPLPSDRHSNPNLRISSSFSEFRIQCGGTSLREASLDYHAKLRALLAPGHCPAHHSACLWGCWRLRVSFQNVGEAGLRLSVLFQCSAWAPSRCSTLFTKWLNSWPSLLNLVLCIL